MSCFKRTSVFLPTLLLTIAASFHANPARGERPIRGTYQVPTSPELASSATFPVKFHADRYFSDPNQLRFPLPEELTGVPTWVTMKKQADGSWAGENVQGQCTRTKRQFSCTVSFQHLVFDSQSAKEFIQARYPDPEEALRRSQVQTAFEGEPIGILTYELRGRHGMED